MNAEALLELQLADTSIDQLKFRLAHLPESADAASAAAELATWQRRDDTLRRQLIDLEGRIAASEKQSAVLSAQRSRLEMQLKTVIAPREAEALMHEIGTLTTQRSLLDDSELEAMDAMAAAEAELELQQAIHGAIHAASVQAAGIEAAAKATGLAQLGEETTHRDQLRGRLDAGMLDRYDALRAQFGGVGVAKLNGLRCEGCHLDLSRGEVDALKRNEGEEIPECPNCGRLLVR